MGVSLREMAATLEIFSVFRSHQAAFQWVHRVGEKTSDPPTASAAQLVVNEIAVDCSCTAGLGIYTSQIAMHYESTEPTSDKQR